MFSEYSWLRTTSTIMCFFYNTRKDSNSPLTTTVNHNKNIENDLAILSLSYIFKMFSLTLMSTGSVVKRFTPLRHTMGARRNFCRGEPQKAPHKNQKVPHIEENTPSSVKIQQNGPHKVKKLWGDFPEGVRAPTLTSPCRCP